MRVLGLLLALGAAALADEVTDLVNDLVAEDRYVRRQAEQQLQALGADALPALMTALDSDDPGRRTAAVRVLGAIGPAAAPAAPRVLKLLDDEAVAVPAARALGRIGPPARYAVPKLIELGRSERWDRRFAAADALAGIGTASIEPLFEAWVKGDERVRVFAPTVFRALGARVVPVAFRALDSEDKEMRVAGVELLAAAGPRAELAVPKLAQLLNDEAGVVRRAAATALGSIGRGAADAVVPLIALVSDESRRATLQAIEALGDILRDAAEARWDERRRPRAEVQEQIALGLRWLALHQAEDGRWDSDGFPELDPPDDRTDGPGGAAYDQGVTGLALVAILESGQAEPYAETVQAGLRWLVSTQAADGCFDSRQLTPHHVYNHALAALAMATAARVLGDPLYRDSAQRALDYAAAVRNPDEGWRYQPRDGDNDTSVTTWMVAALRAGELAGLRVERAAYQGALRYVDDVVNPATGRTGYSLDVKVEARPTGLDQRFPSTLSRAMTAAAVRVRQIAGENARTSPLLAKGIDQCLEVLPDWNPDTGAIDMYYWYQGTLALYHEGGAPWRKWEKPLRDAVGRHQHPKGSGARTGSFDPIGAWGGDGGRVYSTALMVLCLEALDGRPLPLARPGPADARLRQALAVLKRAVRHDDPAVRDAALRALAGFGR